jgi:hypothetical protein
LGGIWSETCNSMGVESEGLEMSVMNDFASWLDEELSQRGWDEGQLSERSSVSVEALGKARRGAPLSWEACVKIARALEVSPDVVLRKGGGLPPTHEGEIDLEDWCKVLALLPPNERDELYQMAVIKLNMLRMVWA